jgi:Na+/glutamate symporter
MKGLTFALLVVALLALVMLGGPAWLASNTSLEAKVLAPSSAQIAEVVVMQNNHTIALVENNRSPIFGTYLGNLITSPITEGHAFAVASASTATNHNHPAYNVSMATATFGQTTFAVAHKFNVYGGSKDGKNFNYACALSGHQTNQQML